MVTQVRPSTISRRGFFKLAVQHAVTVTSLLYLIPELGLRAESSEDKGDHIPQSLTLMAHDIFPHDGLDERIYQKVAQAINDEMSTSVEKRKKIMDGMDRLDGFTPATPWEELVPDQRIELLKKFQSDPFFTYVRNLSLQVIYRDPEVWKRIGYGGSSIEYGGYVNRGFNNINWLPKTE